MKTLVKKIIQKLGIEVKRTGKIRVLGIEITRMKNKNTRSVYNEISKYPYLNRNYNLLLKLTSGARDNYIWGCLAGTDLARTLGYKRISFLEFGVAGGDGLVDLEKIAIELEKIFKLEIIVFGFDTGSGLTKPQGYKDLAHLWNEGYYPMNVEKLKSQLKKAQLILGPVEETIDGFLEENDSAIAFISFDMDLYTPTKKAFEIFNSKYSVLLPRIHCYFDDIMGYSYCEYNGERLAIREYNDENDLKKIAPIYSLEKYIDGRPDWAKKIYLAHLFSHPLYNKNDGMLINPDLPIQ